MMEYGVEDSSGFLFLLFLFYFIFLFPNLPSMDSHLPALERSVLCARVPNSMGLFWSGVRQNRLY